MVRLHALRLARCEHAQQHIARAGTGWQAHLSQPGRRQAQCSRSCPRPRVLLAISHPLDDSAASLPTCNPSHSSVHRSLGYRAGFLHSPHCGGCRNPGLQPGLGRTDEREGSQDASEAKRVFFSDPTHLKPDPASRGWGSIRWRGRTWRPPALSRRQKWGCGLEEAQRVVSMRRPTNARPSRGAEYVIPQHGSGEN